MWNLWRLIFPLRNKLVIFIPSEEMHWVKQAPACVSSIRPGQKVTRHGIFLSWWCALKSFLSAKWSSMARESTLLLLLVCLGHVLTQDVADCTWQPKQDAVESTSLECHLKTLQTGPAVIPQVSHHHQWPSDVVYLLVSLAKLWMCEKGGIQLSKPELSCIQT